MLDFHFNQPYSNDNFYGYYVNNFADMEKLAPPFGGSVVGVNIDAGFLWSKKLDHNGVPVYRTFKLEELKTETENERLSREVQELKKELELLKGGNVNVSKNVNESAYGTIKNEESSSLQSDLTDAI